MNKYRERLQELANENGRLTPAMVVDDAKRDESPLHDFFEWDDSKAGVSHRLNQARTLIRSVRVVFRTEHIKIKAPVYVRDPDANPKDQGYIAIPSVIDDKERCRRALVDEIARADAHLDRAHKIATAMGLAKEFDTIRAELAGLLTRASA